MDSTYKPMSLFLKIVFWFVAINALAGAVSLILFPANTDTLFFWKITPPISAALFGALYLGGAIVVAYVTRQGLWEPARYLVPMAPLTRVVAITMGAILVLLGVMVLTWPNLVIAIWPWTITPLMTRIFASWFSAFGVGLLWFLRERDWSRLYPIANLMTAAAGLDLLMVFIHRNDLISTGLNFWLFCFHLAAFGLVGGFMHWYQHRATVNKPASQVPSV